MLRLEDVNFDGEQRRPVWCYAISAKRYALYTLEADGAPTIVKYSEHGLGHLLNPTNPEADDRAWMRALWAGIVRNAHGLPLVWPAWLTRPAVSRITASRPYVLRPFRALNAGKPYVGQVKPFNFLLLAHVTPFGQPLGCVRPVTLVAPYNPDARQWRKRRWTDLYSGRHYAIATGGQPSESGARVQSYQDVLTAYRHHPESKSAGPDGEPCGKQTAGVLRRRAVRAGSVIYVGKESSRLDEVQARLISDVSAVVTEYRPRSDVRQLICPGCQQPFTAVSPRARVCSKRCEKRVKRSQQKLS